MNPTSTLRGLLAATLAASSAFAAPAFAQDGPSTSPTGMVDALNATFGQHAGKRASHAKGFCAAGEFKPDKRATDFVNGPLFKQKSVPATVRFSIGGGNPNASDKSRSVRGLTMRLTGAGEVYDLLMISEPAFFAATPESFVSFLQARVPDPATKKPDPAKIAAHNAAFPDGTRQPALLAAHAAPASYANTPYFSNNAFNFKSRSGSSQVARLVAEPLDGTKYLSEAEEKSLPDVFLEAELGTRLNGGTVGYTLFAQLPAKGDSSVDPSTVWAGTLKVAIGTLTVKQLTPADSCDGLVFMPLSLPTGITGTDDPILNARVAPYAVSLSRRTAK